MNWRPGDLVRAVQAVPDEKIELGELLVIDEVQPMCPRPYLRVLRPGRNSQVEIHSSLVERPPIAWLRRRLRRLESELACVENSLATRTRASMATRKPRP